MDKLVQGVPNGETIFIGGDLNVHIGKDSGALQKFMVAMDME